MGEEKRRKFGRMGLNLVNLKEFEEFEGQFGEWGLGPSAIGGLPQWPQAPG